MANLIIDLNQNLSLINLTIDLKYILFNINYKSTIFIFKIEKKKILKYKFNIILNFNF